MTDLTTADTAAMRRAGTWRDYLRTEMDRGRTRATTPPPAPQPAAPRTVVDVPCPHCSAPAGRPCTTRTGRRAVPRPHDARQQAYATLAAREMV